MPLTLLMEGLLRCRYDLLSTFRVGNNPTISIIVLVMILLNVFTLSWYKNLP